MGSPTTSETDAVPVECVECGHFPVHWVEESYWCGECGATFQRSSAD